ncbi:MAG: esterase/lipase family protein [Pirellulaceae bacterium]
MPPVCLDPPSLDRSHRWDSQLLSAMVYLIASISALGCSQWKHDLWFDSHPDWKSISLRSPRGNSEPVLDKALQCARLAAARELRSDPKAVDLFATSCTLAWQAMGRAIDDRSRWEKALQAYHQSLEGLLRAGRTCGRWRPGQGIELCDAKGQTSLIAMSPQDGPWKATDHMQIIPVGSYHSKRNESKRVEGFGVPIVAVRLQSSEKVTDQDTPDSIRIDCPARPEERFLLERASWDATVVFRPDRFSEEVDQPVASGTLEIYRPVYRDRALGPRVDLSLASAPGAQQAWNSTQDPQLQGFLEQFLRPEDPTARRGLIMIEPYQPGKIPVVFTHGLLSNPQTWQPVLLQLQHNRWFQERFQIWGFGYGSGEPFLESAAELRKELAEAHATIDPSDSDAALQQKVLVGYSMGGLISKLQGIDPEDHLWNAVAQGPWDSLQADPQLKERLSAAFFFEPNQKVSRIIFIGTPHRGAKMAQQTVGRLGSLLVDFPEEDKERFEQLVRDNPGLFRPEIARRFPTSIDMLRPDGEVLKTLAEIPLADGIIGHSIVGDLGPWRVVEPGDGVVPLTSARWDGVSSEQMVPQCHEELHRDPRSVAELLRILREIAE